MTRLRDAYGVAGRVSNGRFDLVTLLRWWFLCAAAPLREKAG
jgi:hypothetical protein